MRAFVAVDVLDAKVLDGLADFQRVLVKSGADLKVVERENLHFTLRFLGEIPDGAAAEVKRRLSSLSLKGGDLELEGAGAFPGPARPRVVWVGVSGRTEATLTPVAEAVLLALRGIGEEDRRDFQPHLTIARVRSSRGHEALETLLKENSRRSFGTTPLANLKLKSSLLTPRGPVYTDVAVYPLS